MKKFYVLDTNVLMHDPAALFRFAEHDVFLPMVVLEELDKHKIGISEVARNVRQVSRFIDEMLDLDDQSSIKNGINLNTNKLANEEINASGKLLFQQDTPSHPLPSGFPGNTPDNQILAAAYDLDQEHPDAVVNVISKDINLRIKASILGLPNQDYTTDQVLDDADLLYSGITRLPETFWEDHAKDMDSWSEAGITYHKLSGPEVKNFYPKQCLLIEQNDSAYQALVSSTDEEQALIRTAKDYSSDSNNAVWGISARNEEQNFALNLLMDPEIDLVTLLGNAGTGKTILTLAAALAQTLEENLYKEIIMTRVTVPVGDDIGFLPGTEEEKMSPWMGALMDNLEVLNESEANDWERSATADFLQNRIKIKSLNFMRGRTFLNRFIILDEAQNLTAKQMKTLITRAGPGTKVVCLGNIAQIDTPYLTETTSGLTYVVDHFKAWEHSGHIILQRGERSRLADHAAQIL